MEFRRVLEGVVSLGCMEGLAGDCELNGWLEGGVDFTYTWRLRAASISGRRRKKNVT